MSTHPRSNKGEGISKEDIKSDIRQKYLEQGIVSSTQYEKEGEYCLTSVLRHYNSFPDALKELGLPTLEDIPEMIREIIEIKESTGKIDETIYDEKGSFPVRTVEPALDTSWEEIKKLI